MKPKVVEQVIRQDILNVRHGRWILLLIVVAALGYIFRDGLYFMTQEWSREEYSHGYLIPVVALFIAWQNSKNWAERVSSGSWSGVLIVVLGLVVFLMGELGTIYTIVQYAFLITLFGCVLALVGWGGMRHLWVAILYLAFMIPLPDFFYSTLSSKLQLISSGLGVAIIRLFGVSVFLAGNIIDLGVYQLQVVEACSGLRYLFPLMSFGFLCAYLLKGPLWQKAVVFLSTIPITVLMNSLRIGIIGVLVEYQGIEVAVGFLHDFEGWAVFLSCLVILFTEVWLLANLGRKVRPFSQLFNLEVSKPTVWFPLGSRIKGSFAAAGAILLFGAVGTTFMSERAEAIPERQQFGSFPTRIADWEGRNLGLEGNVIEVLRADDFVNVDYRHARDRSTVNLFVTYYDSQRKGQSVHSPQSCIPGSGWRIADFSQRSLEGVLSDGRLLEVNRAIVKRGDLVQLVYYWFPQRGRFLTNEYLVKWFLFWDSMTRSRTDGGMVRLVTPVPSHDALAEADLRLADFAKLVQPQLTAFFPK